MTDNDKSAKQKLIEAGYQWIKPQNIAAGSARRIICDPRGPKCWIVSSPEEANELADKLLREEL